MIKAIRFQEFYQFLSIILPFLIDFSYHLSKEAYFRSLFSIEYSILLERGGTKFPVSARLVHSCVEITCIVLALIRDRSFARWGQRAEKDSEKERQLAKTNQPPPTMDHVKCIECVIRSTVVIRALWIPQRRHSDDVDVSRTPRRQQSAQS